MLFNDFSMVFMKTTTLKYSCIWAQSWGEYCLCSHNAVERACGDQITHENQTRLSASLKRECLNAFSVINFFYCSFSTRFSPVQLCHLCGIMIRNIKNFTLISTEIPALHIDRIVFIESTEAALAPAGQLTPEVCTVAPAWVCDGQLWVNFVCAVQTQSCQCTAVRQWSSKTK